MKKLTTEYRDTTSSNFRNKRKSIETNAHYKTVNDDYDCYQNHQENLREYVRHLEEANRNLHRELDEQKNRSHQEIMRLKKKLETK